MIYTVAEIVRQSFFGEIFYINHESFTDEVAAQHHLAEMQMFNPYMQLVIREE